MGGANRLQIIFLDQQRQKSPPPCPPLVHGSPSQIAWFPSWSRAARDRAQQLSVAGAAPGQPSAESPKMASPRQIGGIILRCKSALQCADHCLVAPVDLRRQITEALGMHTSSWYNPQQFLRLQIAAKSRPPAWSRSKTAFIRGSKGKMHICQVRTSSAVLTTGSPSPGIGNCSVYPQYIQESFPFPGTKRPQQPSSCPGQSLVPLFLQN